MLRTVFAIPALAVAATLAAGCGSSKTAADGTTSAAANTSAQPQTQTTVSVATGAPLSHSVWIAKGDVICAKLNGQLEASVVRTTADLQRILPQAAVYERTALAQLSTLVPPPAQAHDWNELLHNVQGWSNASAKLATEAQGSTFQPRASMFTAGTAYHEAFARIAKRDGFKQCSVT